MPGDVVVAVSTDLGWTPLFIPAAAVILQTGGELQHGSTGGARVRQALRERYRDVRSRFVDGQMVEVNGDGGVVRFLVSAAAESGRWRVWR